MKLLRTGKVKEVYEVSPTELEFRFTDQISVFDKVIPSLVPHKGATLCRTSAHWFGVLAAMGVRTHFLGLVGPDRMRVRRVEVIPQYDKIAATSTKFLIPLEVIARYYVAGSLDDRLKKGKLRPEDVGFAPGHMPKYGEPLPEPFLEVTTKLETVDRELTTAEALSISKLSQDEFDDLMELVLRIDGRIDRDVRSRGLLHVDGKKEFAFDERRELMVVDTFGTADEDRFWDLAAYERGEHVERSKEFVRQHYRRSGYHAKLMEARARGGPEPDIPALPPEVLAQVRDLYVRLFEQITGQHFL